jgi:hypothetical protein
MTGIVAGAHRLLLDGDELHVLLKAGAVDVFPGDFDVTDPSPEADLEVIERLVQRGLLRHDTDDENRLELRAVLAGDLQVLSAPQILISTRVQLRERQIYAAHALLANAGASLVRSAGPEVELSLFPAVDLGRELARVVPSSSDQPDTPELDGLDLPYAAFLQAVAVGAGTTSSDAGLVGELPEAQRAALATAASAFDGSVQVAVSARPPDGSALVQIGQVVWVHAGRWFGLSPYVGDDGTHRVRMVPAQAADLGIWVAPFVAGALL